MMNIEHGLDLVASEVHLYNPNHFQCVNEAFSFPFYCDYLVDLDFRFNNVCVVCYQSPVMVGLLLVMGLPMTVR